MRSADVGECALKIASGGGLVKIRQNWPGHHIIAKTKKRKRKRTLELKKKKCRCLAKENEKKGAWSGPCKALFFNPC